MARNENTGCCIRSFWIAIALFVLLELLMALVLLKLYEDRKQFILSKRSELFENNYKTLIGGYNKITDVIFEGMINRSEIIKMLNEAMSGSDETKNKIRAKLYEMLTPAYDKIKKIKFKQLQFHWPDSTSFFRIHRPGKYGDSLRGIRYSVELANAAKKKVAGFEEGRMHNGFRHVYPIIDGQGRHVGSVELSLSSASLREDIEKVCNGVVDFIVLKKIVDKKVWKGELGNYQDSIYSHSYMTETSISDDKRILNVRDRIKDGLRHTVGGLLDSGGKFSVYHHEHIITFLPIPSISGVKNAAYLVGIDQTNIISRLQFDSRVTFAVGSVLAFIVSMLLYQLLIKMEMIRQLAIHDRLTKAYGRGAMMDFVGAEIDRLGRSDSQLSVLYADIDYFKRVNDNYGHKKGDEVLKAVADVFMSNSRKTDKIGRWGGEEFLIALPGADLAQAVMVAEKYRAIIARLSFEGSDGDFYVTCSFGVAEYRDDEGLESLVDRADKKLYEAKESGRDRVVS